MTIPYYGPYNASKHALEAMTENYRLELSSFGISSHLIEPGGFPTNFAENLIYLSDTSRELNYQSISPNPEQFGAAFGETLAANPQQDPQKVADALLELVETSQEERPFRKLVDTLGMGDALKGYNEASDQIADGIAKAFGYDHFLTLKN